MINVKFINKINPRQSSQTNPESLIRSQSPKTDKFSNDMVHILQ